MPKVTQLVSDGAHRHGSHSRVLLLAVLGEVEAVLKHSAAEEAGVGWLITSEGCLSPEAISDLHIIVPAQAAAVQVHGCEVQNDLGEQGEEEGYAALHTSQASPASLRTTALLS